MNSDEKLTLLALAKGFREVLRQAASEVCGTLDTLHRQLRELEQLIDQLTEKE